MKETELFHHAYRPIPFTYQLVHGHIKAQVDTPLEKWLQKYGHNRNVYGYSPLSLSKDTSLKSKWQNTVGYLVGKGPSLAHLKPTHFVVANAPVIALEEAYAVVKKLKIANPIFFLQCDQPTYCMVADDDYKICAPKAGRHYFMQHNLIIAEVDRHPLFLATIYAIRIAKYFGCINIKMLCFDALDGITGYPDVVKKMVPYPTDEIDLPDHLFQATKIKQVLEQEYPKYRHERPK